MSITYINERPTIIVRSGMGPGILYNRDGKRPIYIGRDGSIVYGNQNSGSILDPLASLYVAGDTDIFAVAPVGTDANNAIPVDFIHSGRSQYHQSATILSEPIQQVATGIGDLGQVTAEMQQLLTQQQDILNLNTEILNAILAQLGGSPIMPTVPSGLQPSDLGFAGWNMNPMFLLSTSNAQPLSFGAIALVKVRGNGPVNNLGMLFTGVSASFTSLFPGIYDDTGTLLGTGPGTIPGGSTPSPSTVALMPFTSPITLNPSRLYYAALLGIGSGSFAVCATGASPVSSFYWWANTQSNPQVPWGIFPGPYTELPAHVDLSQWNPTSPIAGLCPIVVLK